MSYERGGDGPEMGEEAAASGNARAGGSSRARRSPSRSRSPPRRQRSRSRSRSPYNSRRSRRSPSPRGGRHGYRGGDRGPPPPPPRGGDYPPYGGGGRGGGYDDRYGPPRDYPPYGDYPPRGGGPPPHYRGGPPPFDYRGGGGGGGGPPPFRRDRSPRRGDRGPRRDEGPPGVSLLVRNIGAQVTSQDLSQAFGRIGELRDVYIPRDYHSNTPRGFAFIEFAEPRQAKEARDEMDRFVIKGREIEVVFAQERRKTPGEMKDRVVSQPRGSSQDNGDDNGKDRDRERERERDRDRPQDSDRPERGRSNSYDEERNGDRV